MAVHHIVAKWEPDEMCFETSRGIKAAQQPEAPDQLKYTQYEADKSQKDCHPIYANAPFSMTRWLLETPDKEPWTVIAHVTNKLSERGADRIEGNEGIKFDTETSNLAYSKYEADAGSGDSKEARSLRMTILLGNRLIYLEWYHVARDIDNRFSAYSHPPLQA